MVSVNLKLEDNLAQQLSTVCDRKGYSQDELVRSLIVSYLKREDPALLTKLDKADFKSLHTLLNIED
jgi:hypothetical protein